MKLNVKGLVFVGFAAAVLANAAAFAADPTTGDKIVTSKTYVDNKYTNGTGISATENQDGQIVFSTTAEQNVQANWNETDTDSDAYILNKPTIPAAQIQSDWSQADNSAVDYIKNKPTIPAAQVQSDWSQADNSAVDFIKNKPTLAPSNAEQNVQANWNETDTDSDAYILNKPTIPAAQVQSDWSQADSSAVDYIKNKPAWSLPTNPTGNDACSPTNPCALVWDGNGTTGPAWVHIQQ